MIKISQKFPVLQKTTALVIVTGVHSAVVYRINKGEINEKDTLTIPKPSYSDREGFFQYKGPRGRLHGSGSVYEPKKEYMQTKFLAQLALITKNIKKSYHSIYLFAPQRIIKNIEEALPKTIAKKISYKIAGNFTKHHPTDLLKLIKSQRTKNIAPTPPQTKLR